MADTVTEHAGSVLRVQFNRPTKRNAMASAMYVALAGIFNEAANDENTRASSGTARGIRSARVTISRIF